MKKSALGKGLSALISDLPLDIPSKEGVIAEIPMKDILVNKNQPRKVFDQEALEELAISIKENGLIQPIVVNPVQHGKYQIIVGERRFRASQIAGLTVIPVIIKKADEDKIFTWALLENIQREDLNSIEIATAYLELMERLSLTQEALAQLLGKSRSAVANTLRLLKLPNSIQEDVLAGRLTEGHARTISSLSNIDEQLVLRDQIISEGLNVRESEVRVKNYKTPSVKNPAKNKLQSGNSYTLKQVETDISSQLELKVKLTSKDEKSGKFELYYSNGEEFERLKKILTQQNKFWI